MDLRAASVGTIYSRVPLLYFSLRKRRGSETLSESSGDECSWSDDTAVGFTPPVMSECTAALVLMNLSQQQPRMSAHSVADDDDEEATAAAAPTPDTVAGTCVCPGVERRARIVRWRAHVRVCADLGDKEEGRQDVCACVRR